MRAAEVAVLDRRPPRRPFALPTRSSPYLTIHEHQITHSIRRGAKFQDLVSGSPSLVKVMQSANEVLTMFGLKSQVTVIDVIYAAWGPTGLNQDTPHSAIHTINKFCGLLRTDRLPATRSINNSLGGTYLHWCCAPSGRTAKVSLAASDSYDLFTNTI